MAKLRLLLVAALALASVATAMEAPPKPATTTMCSEFDCEAAGKVRRASAAFTQGNSVDGCCKDKATTCGDFDCKAEGKVRVKNAEKLHHADAASCCRDASTEAPCADYAGCDAKTEVLCKGAGKKKQGTKPKETCCVAKPAVMCDKYLNDDGVTSKCEKPTLLVLHPEKVAQNGDAKGNCCKDPKKLGKRLKKEGSCDAFDCAAKNMDRIASAAFTPIGDEHRCCLARGRNTDGSVDTSQGKKTCASFDCEGAKKMLVKNAKDIIDHIDEHTCCMAPAKTCDLFKDCIKTGKVQIKNSAEKLQGDDPDKACCEGAPKRKTCDTFQCPENRVKVLNAKSVVGSSGKDCCVMNKAEAAAKKAGGDAQTKETEAAPEPKATDTDGTVTAQGVGITDESHCDKRSVCAYIKGKMVEMAKKAAAPEDPMFTGKVPGTQSFNERKAKEAEEAATPAVGKAKAAAVFDCEVYKGKSDGEGKSCKTVCMDTLMLIKDKKTSWQDVKCAVNAPPTLPAPVPKAGDAAKAAAKAADAKGSLRGKTIST